MKKTGIIQILILVILMTVCGVQVAYADDIESGTCGEGITWSIDDSGCLTVSGSGDMNDYSADEDNPVPWAAYKLEINSIRIRGNISHIGDYSFFDCQNVSSVSGSDSATSIGAEAFGRCRSLEYIPLGENLQSIGDAAFERCIILSGIGLPKRVREIGDNAFYGCIEVYSVNICKGVRKIGSKAFGGCTSLARIEIQCTVPESLTDAFYGYTGEIYYPGDDNLWNENTRNAWCSTAKWVPVYSNIQDDPAAPAKGRCGPNAYWTINSYGCLNISGTGEIYDYTSGSTKKPPWTGSNKKIKSIYIESGITGIGNYAFQGCSSADSVTIPATVTEIGRGAFKGCSSLTDIELPSKLETIGLYAFQNCSSIEYFETPARVTEWNRYMLSGCTSLKKAVIPTTVKDIDDGLFKDCPSLEVVLIKCKAPNKATTAFSEYSGKIYYPGDASSWNESARAAWAPDAEWVDRSKVTFDGSPYTKLNSDGTASQTELTSDMFKETLEEIAELMPEEVVISLKPSGDLSKVKKAEIKCPVNIAKAAMDLPAKFTVEFADGAFTLDAESLQGAIRSDSEYILIKLTDLSNYSVSIETYYNVTMKVCSDSEERLITEVDGLAETTIPVMYRKDATLFAYADHDGVRHDASSYLPEDGLAVIGSSYVGDGGTQGKDWKNASMTLSKRSFIYSGSRQDPGVKVFIRLANGQSFTLKKGLHYSLNESNWIKVGDRSVKASPIRNSDVANVLSKGSLIDKIRISPKAVSASVTAGAKKITVKMSTAVANTGGRYYKIYYRKSGASKWKTISGVSKQSKVITGLSVNRKYQVCVKAYTGSYNGKLSTVKTSGYVKPSKINSPSLKSLSLTTSRATVSMGSPSSYFTGIKYSAQYYKTGSGSWGKVQGFKQHSRTKISFTDGKAGKKYKIRVRVSGYFHGKKYTSSYKYFSYTAR